MKKRILFGLLFLVIAMLLSFSAYAKEYNPTNGNELNDALVEIANNDEAAVINLSGDYTSHVSDYNISKTSKVTFNLLGDSELAWRIVVNGESEVVFNLNGNTLRNNSSRGGESGCLILVNDDATLKIYDGTISISDVGICFQDGTLEMEGVDFQAGEEPIWCAQGGCDGSGRNYYIKNCTLSGNDPVNIYCANADSYVINCNFPKKGMKIDGWHQHSDEKISTARFENLTITNAVEDHTSSNYYIFRSCSFGSVLIGGDNGGKGEFYFYDVTHGAVSYRDKTGYLYDYRSATCTESASLTVYDTITKKGTPNEEYALQNPALGHMIDTENAMDLIYTSYYENGRYISSCKRCSCEGIEEEKGSALPLFVCLGYSALEGDGDGITLGYRINQSAIDEYASITGKNISYSLFAVAKNNLGTGDVLDEELKPSSGVITAELSKNKYSILNLKIVGFANDEQKSADIALGLYAITEKNGTRDVVYLQRKAPIGEEKYHYTSYNEIVNIDK